jgi:hypothetical protein
VLNELTKSTKLLFSRTVHLHLPVIQQVYDDGSFLPTQSIGRDPIARQPLRLIGITPVTWLDAQIWVIWVIDIGVSGQTGRCALV